MPAETPLDAVVPDSPLLVRAYRGEAVERTPVWFMRQAGRSLPEYHEVKGRRSLLDVVHEPADAAEITLQPVRRHGVDAAILYSDIVVPLAAMGVGVTIQAGVGPVMDEPIRTRTDVDRIGAFDPDAHAPYVAETVRLVREALDPSVALIGFAGAPFTLASYLVEGGPSKEQPRTKALMHGDPQTFRLLLERLADVVVESLRAQVRAGAQAVQIFDSWIGSLSRAQFELHVQPVMQRLVARVREIRSDVPVVLFGTGTYHLVEPLAATGCDVLGLDWRTPVDDAASRIGGRTVLQGNLDPTLLLASDDDAIEAGVRDVLAQVPATRGHVFNLGHGVLPQTDPEVPGRIAALVRSLTTTRTETFA